MITYLGDKIDIRLAAFFLLHAFIGKFPVVEVKPSQQVGGGKIRVQGFGSKAVGIFLDIREMSPVLTENRALHGQRAVRLIQLQAQRFPQIEIAFLQRIRRLHAAQVYVHKLNQLFLALGTNGIAGICIVRKPVHKGGIAFAVHIKEYVPAGVFPAGGQKKVFQNVVGVSLICLRCPVDQVKSQFGVIVLYV